MVSIQLQKNLILTGIAYGANQDADLFFTGVVQVYFLTGFGRLLFSRKMTLDGKWKKLVGNFTGKKAMGIHRNAEGELEGESANYRDMFKNRDSRFYSTVTTMEHIWNRKKNVILFKLD